MSARPIAPVIPPSGVPSRELKGRLRAVSPLPLGGVLQDAGIKPDSVASSIDTVSGLAMIRALTGGERRGEVLAEPARGRMRAYSRRGSPGRESRWSPSGPSGTLVPYIR